MSAVTAPNSPTAKEAGQVTLRQQEAVLRARAKIEREDPNGYYAHIYEACANTVAAHSALLSRVSELEAKVAELEPTAEPCSTCKERPGLVRVDGNPMLGSWDICPDCNTCHECRGTGKRAALLERS